MVSSQRIPTFIYKNKFIDYPEYIYNDAYLMVFKKDNYYSVYEADKNFEFDISKEDFFSFEELKELVSDDERFELYNYNP